MTQDSIKKCISQIIQQNPLIKNVFQEIVKAKGQVLLVGGAVRDCLLGQQVSDLDFEIYHLSFQQIESILQKFGIVSFVGKSFGVLRLHGLDVDWSIPRKDSIGRKPKVSFDEHMSFQDAFIRRDLTINAMGIDVETLELIDPFNGLQDLKHKVLRSPDLSFFVQDPLRLFRVMQFAARLEMKVDENLSEACSSMDITSVSAERIAQEFKKMFLKSDKPSIGLLWLQSIGRLQEVLQGIRCDQFCMKALDCLAQQGLRKEDRLSCLWGCLTSFMSKDQEISVEEPMTKEYQQSVSFAIAPYIDSKATLQSAVSIGHYVRYVSVLADSGSLKMYKWLAYWFNKTGSLSFLSQVAGCWYDKEVVTSFLKGAQSAGVSQGPEEPLLIAADLQPLYQGQKLGLALKKAYKIQLDESIIDKKQLLQLMQVDK